MLSQPTQLPVGERECGCPEWTRCGHFGNRVLWMVLPTHPHVSHATRHQFYVNVGRVMPDCTSRCGEPVLRGTSVQRFNDEAAANAEFDKQELLLLGRKG